MNKATSFLIMLICVFLDCFSQEEKRFSVDKEISSNLINDIYQDKRGYVWIATEDGLNKSDGVRFIIYQKDDNTHNSLSNNFVKTVREDSKGRIWICTISSVDIYDYASDNFRHIKLFKDKQLIYPLVNSMVETSWGDLWFGSENHGLCVLRRDSVDSALYFDDELNKRLGNVTIRQLHKDSLHRIWIATVEKGVFLYIREGDRLLSVRSKNEILYDASGISEDNNGNIFAISAMHKMYMLKRGEIEFNPISFEDRDEHYKLKCIQPYLNSDQLLIGTDGQGMLQYDYQKNMIVKSHFKMGFFDFRKAKIHCMLKDRDNNLWISLFQKGILLKPGKHVAFDYYGQNSVYKNTIGDCAVLCVCSDGENNIFLGTDNDGIYYIQKNGTLIKHYNEGIPSVIESMYIDSMNRLWIGSYKEGFGILDRKSGRYRRIKASFLPDNLSVASIVEDKDQNLWVGTWDVGLLKIDIKTGKIKNFKSVGDLSRDALPYNWVKCLLLDNSYLWIGTYRGLARYDLKKKTFLTDNKSSLYLFSNAVISLNKDNDGNLWVASNNGLYRVSPKKEVLSYTVLNGLPSNTICSILDDNQGNLWLGTHRGLSKLDKKRNRFYNFNTSDGLQGNEFSYNCCFKDKSGCFYFAGQNGLTSFTPEHIKNKVEKKIVHFTELYVAGRKVTIDSKSGGENIIYKEIDGADAIYLDANDNSFSLHFSTFDYINPEKEKLEYRIIGLDNQWMPVNNISSLSFYALAPNDYTLQIRVVSEDGNSPIKSINVFVRSPWYSTLLAKIIWTMLILAIVYSLYSFGKKNQNQKKFIDEQRRKERENEDRMQFYINIVHELRSPITLITSPLEKLMSDRQEPYRLYQLMYKNATRVLKLTNQLLDIRKVDKGYLKLMFEEVDIVDFINDIIQSYQYNLEKKNIHCSVKSESDEKIKVWVDPNQFDKVVNNLMSNALKYTAYDGKINFIISKVHTSEKECCNIVIEDDGIGIEENETDRIFERFYQITKSQNSSDIGTGIGLHLTKLIVELHHGQIKAEKRYDVEHGSRFNIEIPLGNEHISKAEISNGSSNRHDNMIVEAEREKWIDVNNNLEEGEFSVRKETLLIVEDELDIKLFLSSELESMYNIITASDGEEGLMVLHERKVDFIISDMMMPHMDGLTFCKNVKSNNQTSDIPLVILTAQNSIDNKVECLSIGADAYMEKPFNMNVLQSTIHGLIRNRKIIKGKINSDNLINQHVNTPSLKSNDDFLLERMVKIINENISNSQFSVDDLSVEVGVSRAHLYRKIKGLTNLSAAEFIREARIQHAEKLLKLNKSYSIADIAYAVGFEKPKYFSLLFKERYSMTPKEYRERNCGINQDATSND